MTTASIPASARRVQFLGFFDAYCEHCARPLQILARQGVDNRRLIACHSRACPCQLDTLTLAGLLDGQRFAMVTYRCLRRGMFAALGVACAESLAQTMDYPLPPYLEKAVGAIYHFRMREETAERALHALGEFFREEDSSGVLVHFACQTYAEVCEEFGVPAPYTEVAA